MSTLRAAAAEFVPLTNVTGNTQLSLKQVSGVSGAETSEQQLEQQREDQATGGQLDDQEEWQGGYYDEGYYDESGNWVYYDSDAWHEGQAAAAGESDQHWQWPLHQRSDQDLPATEELNATEAADSEQEWRTLAVQTDQAVGLLHAWYPTYSKPMLQQLYEACNYQLQDTLNILTEMEYEQTTPDIPGSQTKNSKPATARVVRQATQQSAQEWPSLATAAAGCADDVANSSTTNSSSSSWATVAKKAAAPSAAAAAAATAMSGTAIRSQQRYSSNSSSCQGGAEAVPWVKTGAAVSQEYADARAEASDYARVRNACFHQATIAYLSGNKALAKELSAKGKEAAQKMWQAHQRASQQIFTQRNAGLAAQTSSPLSAAVAAAAETMITRRLQPSTGSSGVIDLHGLHVREVQNQMPGQLSALAAQGQRSVSIIVGVGKHTKGPPGPRLLPAVETVLQDLNLRYQQPQPGLLRVDLTRLR